MTEPTPLIVKHEPITLTAEEVMLALAQLTDKLRFVMQTMHLKVVIANGLLDANGQPTGMAFEGSLLQLYDQMQARQSPVASVTPPSLVSDCPQCAALGPLEDDDNA